MTQMILDVDRLRIMAPVRLTLGFFQNYSSASVTATYPHMIWHGPYHHQLIGLREKLQERPHDLHGKIYGFLSTH